MVELAPVQKAQDINDRCEKAMKEIEPILKKYQVEFHARLQPLESAIVALPCLRDTKYTLKKSPIQMI